MIRGIRVKVCGLTREQDVRAALDCGADFLGLIVHTASPRHLGADRFRAMAASVPGGRRVVVSVSPTVDELRGMKAAGAAAFQIHCPAEAPTALVRSWSEAVGADSLWLAPRLPPDADLPEAWLPLAGTFLLDSYAANRFGGTGKTGDWGKFARHRRAHPEKTWILSGGLNPENIRAALERSGADFIDVNSGVESAPGLKDPARLKALFAALGA